jgi:hypothetical protein
MKIKALLLTILILGIGASVIAVAIRTFLPREQYEALQNITATPIVREYIPTPTTSPISTGTQPIQVANPLPKSKTIPSRGHTFQTFNNCGPATYSMLLQYSDINVSQKELGDFLRPYQVASGDNDDKSVSMEEIAEHAKQYNLTPYHRPNGSIDLLKQFIAADYPVVLRTWLNNKEDIGHFIIIRGYDDAKQEIIFDDSYYNPNRKTSYNALLSLWQPFNYEYLVLSKPENTEKIEQILQGEKDLQIAWQNAKSRSQEEQKTDSTNPFPSFNEARASFYLEDYQTTIQKYEQVKDKLPGRMLWYQYEPILAYQKVGDHQKVFQLTDAILNNHNRAYSELYYIRAQSHTAQNNNEAAKAELDNAIKYNKNYKPAIELHSTL